MSMYDTSISQKYIKDMGLCKKKKNKRCIPKEGMPHASTCQKRKEKIKDAYPKKVCHMLQHVKKKEIAPDPERKKKKRDGSYKGVHIPSTKNIHTLAHLDQGL